MIEFQKHVRAKTWLTLLLVLLSALSVQIVVEFLLFKPMNDQLAKVSTAHVQQQLPTSDMTRSASNTEPNALQRLRDLEVAAPKLSDNHNRILNWHSLADQHSVKIKGVNYKQSIEATGLGKTVLQAEVETTYLSLRRFIRAVHAADRACGLENITITQNTGGSPILKVQLEFVLYSMSQKPT